MKEAFERLLEVFFELIPVVCLGLLGGFVRTMAGKARGEPYRWSIAIPEIVIAIFAGLLVHWLIRDLSMAEGYKTSSIALAGYSARSIISIINAVFLTTAKKVGEK